MCGSFRRKWTFLTWRPWTLHCCPPSRRRFSSASRFRYRDAKGATTHRLVEPHALLILPPLWYLVAWDPLRDDFRHFRMDRISRPEVAKGATFQRRHVRFEDHVRPVRDLSR
jgi:predicted DNA-binding transcriptional regulator YafY